MVFFQKPVVIGIRYQCFFPFVCEALPALYNTPSVKTEDATASMAVSWDYWSQDIDYGTPPVLGFVVHYGKGSFTNTISTVNETDVTILNLSRGSDYIVAIAVVGKDSIEGMLSPTVATRIKCNGEIQISKERWLNQIGSFI